MHGKKDFLSIFKDTKPILGMLHLKGDTPQSVLKRALLEARQMVDAGVSAVIVENYFGTPENVEAVLAQFQEQGVDFIYGVNVLHQDETAFELARQYGCAFLQLDSVSGHLPPQEDEAFAQKLASLRAGYSGYVLGGVRFKYQPYLSGRSLAQDLALATQRCDAIVVTGDATGALTPVEKIQSFREGIGAFPLVVGAGMTPKSCAAQLALADAAIVGSYFKEGYVDSGDVCPDHVRQFMQAVELCR